MAKKPKGASETSVPSECLVCRAHLHWSKHWFHNLQSYMSLQKSMAHKITNNSSLWYRLAIFVTELNLYHTRSILRTSSLCLLYFSRVSARLLTVWLKLGNLLFQLCNLVVVQYMCICQLSGQRDIKMACCFSCFCICNTHFPAHTPHLCSILLHTALSKAMLLLAPIFKVEETSQNRKAHA